MLPYGVPYAMGIEALLCGLHGAEAMGDEEADILP